MERIVVIGAGVGGLAAAMRLAHSGADVTVVEAHGTPGGKMRTLPSPAGPVDAGPTVLTLRHVFDDLFSASGTRLEDHVTLVREDILARHWWPDGSSLDLHADRDDSARAIRAFAGVQAEDQFRAFAARTSALFDAFDAPLMRAPEPSPVAIALQVAMRPSLFPAIGAVSTMARKLALEFRDPRLRQLFGRYATYVGGSPYQAPAVLRLVADAEARGVWSVTGGMHNLARAMARVASDNGADLRFNSPVDRIEVQGGKTTSVLLSSGERLKADTVIFAGDPNALHSGLMGQSTQAAISKTAVQPRSLSAEVWAFAATPVGPDLARHNVFFNADPRTEFDPISAGNPAEDPTVYVCAQDRGTGQTPPEVERFETIVNAPPTTADQPEDTHACRTRTFTALAARGLRFSPDPPDSALTTPSGFNALFPASHGSLYGRSPHGAMATFARPTARTRIPGLYLAGGGAHPGAGVPMAALSGLHAAAAILTDRTSTSTSRRTGTRGGTSTASPTVGPAPSPSSPS
ncbi:MAG: 1-hydroxycarotenoid 3,4-desaturase CrtD [Pseudomonadota bacterium]